MDKSGIREKQEELRRVRLIYSVRDFQLALSAAEFLSDCDADKNITKIELRRFKCFETAMIVAYARPFSESRSDVPRFSFKMIGLKLTSEELELHKKLIKLRNKAIAHSDAEMMRFLSKPHDIDIGDGRSIVFVETVFDEGLEFIGLFVMIKVINLIRKILHGLAVSVFKESQKNPNHYHMRCDYLDQAQKDPDERFTEEQ